MPTQKYQISKTNGSNKLKNYPTVMCASYTDVSHCCAVIKRAWPCKIF